MITLNREFKTFKKENISKPSLFTILFSFFYSISLGIFSEVNAQGNLPKFIDFKTPNPAPAAPGGAFNAPAMSGTASANAPTFAEWTRTAGPDETLVATGVNFSRHKGVDEGKDTRFTVYSSNGAAKEANIQRLDGDKAIITLNKDLPAWSMYLIWPGNESGYGAPIAINKTDAWWVGPEKATRGSNIAVYGRNLSQNNDTLRSYVYIKPVNGAGQWAEIKDVNPFKVDFTVPSNLVNGDYEVWTHNGHGGQYGWSGPLKLTVFDEQTWTTATFNVKDFGAKGNGLTDDTYAIKMAIRAAESSYNSTVYFPGGVYMVSNTLFFESNIRMKGSGKDNSIIKCASHFSSQATGLISGKVKDFTIEDLGFVSNGNFRGSIAEPIYLRYGNNITIQNVRLSFQGYHSMNLDGGYRIFVKNSEVIGKNAFLGTGSQLFIDNCHFKLTNDSETALHSWGGIGISLTNSTCQDLNNSNPYDGSGWGKGRFFTGNGNFGGTQFTYIGKNVTKSLATRQAAGVDQNSGEQIMWEGFTAKWYGSAASSTLTTTALNNFSSFTSNMQFAVIVKGKGLGQSRKIVSYSGASITLETPWNVAPDQTSVLAIGNFADRIVVYKNTLTGKPYTVTDDNLIIIASTGIEPFSGTFNFIADNNTIKELRSGIANWATQHEIGIDPNYFSLYSNNKILNCRWGIQNGLYNIKNENPKGTGMLGVAFRNNYISNTNQSGIISSLSHHNISTVDGIVYEHNNFLNVKKGFSPGNDLGAPSWFAFEGNNLENQLFYKNNFSSNGGAFGVKATSKVALRNNNFSGFSSHYNGTLPDVVLEAPLRVIEISGTTGSKISESSLLIWNSGIKAMNWAASANVPWLTMSAANGTIKNERESFTLGLMANPVGMQAGTHTATIAVTVNNVVQKYTVILKLNATTGPKVNIVTPTANTILTTPTNTTITANATTTDGTISKVEFFAGSIKMGEDLTSPYSYTWANATIGTYALTAKATDSNGLTTVSDMVEVLVKNPVTPTPTPTPTPTACVGTGSITWEYWDKISQPKISAIPLNSQPTGTRSLNSFASPVNFSDKYGARVRGYICPPADGNYVFYISSDDQSELWLSTNENPATKQKIASVEGVTNEEQYDKYPSQQSKEFYLKAGQRYYIEALHKDNNHDDHLSVGWKLPNGVLQRPIAGAHLIPFTTTLSNPTVNILTPSNNTTLTAPANISITANATAANGTIRKVEFFAGTTKLGEDLTSPYSFTWANATAGTYGLIAKATDSNGRTAESAEVEVVINNTVATTSCAGTGSISWEYWINTPGTPNTNFSTIPVNNQPSGTRRLNTFATPVDFADNYGARIRGYICPPTDGNYVFYLASDDHSELWLSTNDNPATKQKIASVDGFTNVEQYDKFSSQQSEEIYLKAGQRYYIEVLHQDGTHNDHLSVGWKLPNGNLQRPIAGAHLIPFTTPQVEQSTTCNTTGTILREQWNNFTGSSLSAIPVNSPPTTTSQLTIFEAPTDVTDYYGSRIRGYICPPQTGSYTFWIAGDDDAELWLSTDENPGNKKKIASFLGFTNSREWTKYPTQKSAAIVLEAGRRYYIEALHKETYNGDNLAVAWELPNGILEAPIAGNRLSTFSQTNNIATTKKATETLEFYNQQTEEVTAFPNPFVDQTTIQFSLAVSAEAKLELYNAQGKLVNQLFSGVAKAGETHEIVIAAKNLAAGVYMVKLVTDTKVLTKKIVLAK